jgi:hypothetical protein
MGSPSLKIKKDLHYGKKSTSRQCSHCNHFIKEFEVRGIGGKGLIAWERRCTIIGLEAGRAYRINPDLHCDRYDGSDYLEGLRGKK